jgi:16S rRNA (cytosine1402-N4)-methyltransferase
MRKKRSQSSLKKQPDVEDSGGAPSPLHVSVLLGESLQFLQLSRGGLFVDCTLGLGGHSEAILKVSDDARVLGIDRDRQAIEKAQARLSAYGERFRAVHADYREIKNVLESVEETKVAGVLADLGVSSWQLDAPERGFSFRFDAPLDMRMNADSDEPTAADLLKTLPEEEIARIIYEYGEERFSRRIARRIAERRAQGEAIETTLQLAELVERAVKTGRHERIHPATRTFQALRIAVNRELEDLDVFLRDCIDVLKPDGRAVVIAFHSLEDRIVKKVFRQLAGQCVCPPRFPVCQCGARREIEILTKRPLSAGAAETAANPRARSAKLRACRKLTETEI